MCVFVLLYHRCVWYSGALRTTSQRLSHKTRCHCRSWIEQSDPETVCRLAGLCGFFSLLTVCVLKCKDVYVKSLFHIFEKVSNESFVHMSACVFAVSAGRRRGRHLNHQLQRVGNRKTPDHRRVSRWPRPDPEPAFEPHSHRSVQPLSVNLCIYIHVVLYIQLIVTL